jgi:hypothetical protein
MSLLAQSVPTLRRRRRRVRTQLVVEREFDGGFLHIARVSLGLAVPTLDAHVHRVDRGGEGVDEVQALHQRGALDLPETGLDAAETGIDRVHAAATQQRKRNQPEKK